MTQIQDGATAKLVGYQMEHGHHGSIPELPAGGVVDHFDQEHPAPSSGPVMTGETVMTEQSTGYRPLPGEEYEASDEGETVVKAKVMDAPEGVAAQGVKGAETE